MLVMTWSLHRKTVSGHWSTVWLPPAATSPQLASA